MPRVARPLFRRDMDLVVVRPTKISGKVREPGFELEGVRLHIRQHLYQRRRVGPKGHPWTDMLLLGEFDGKFPPVNFEAPASAEELAATVEAHKQAEVTRAKETLVFWQEVDPAEHEGKWTVEGTEQVFETEDDAHVFIETMVNTTKGLLLNAGEELEDDNAHEPAEEDEGKEKPGGLLGKLGGMLGGGNKPDGEGADSGDDWLDGDGG